MCARKSYENHMQLLCKSYSFLVQLKFPCSFSWLPCRLIVHSYLWHARLKPNRQPNYYAPDFHRRGIIKRKRSVCPSVRPSLCSSVACLDLPQERKGLGSSKSQSNQWTYLEVKRSKVRVVRPINAVTVNDVRSAGIPEIKSISNKVSNKTVTWCRSGELQ